MEGFLDLANLYKQIEAEIEAMPFLELELPQAFKSKVTSIGDRSIFYHKYTAIARKENSDSIIIPNYWFYLAEKLVPYNKELHKYYDHIIGLNLFTSQRLSDLKKAGAALTVEEEQKIDDSCSSSDDASRIKKFLVDYSWWHGGKELGRGQRDYYVSAVLSLSGLINDSSSFLASICEHLRTEPALVSLLEEYYKRNMDRVSEKSNKGICINLKYSQFIPAIKSKPFLLLAGISGTGKSRIVREFAFKSCPKYLQDKDGTTPGNYCMIEVKPNWHDSTELLGYYSNLSGSYQFKKFVKFLVKAMMFPDVPFFVCLDEMNLAPVEQYFAEILSILETRKHPKGSNGEKDMSTIKTEAIIDARYFQELSRIKSAINQETGAAYDNKLTDKQIYMKLFGIDSEENIDDEIGNRKDLTARGLTLPDNVIIIGTVNMDDTTHQFSRKVIDRAMTIEMNGGKLVDMFGGSKDLEYIEDEEEQKKWQHSFSPRYVTADEVLETHPEQAEDIKRILPERLESINMALKGTPFEVSYRVLNELTIMVGVMLDDKKEGDSLEDIINQAVNNILLMKILPRIEGDAEMFALSKAYKDKLGITYNDRLEWLKALAPDIVQAEDTQEESGEDNAGAENESEEKPEDRHARQQTAKDKIQEMIDRLNNQDFTRFWP